MIVWCQDQQNKEWNVFMNTCEELLVWMTYQNEIITTESEKIAGHDIENMNLVEVI